MIVGITGARRDITTAQLHTVRSWLLENLPDIEALHHGCCAGFDTYIANIAGELEIPQVYHPPIDARFQMIFKNNSWPGVWNKPKPYLDRNRDIVDQSTILITGPSTDREQVRSGTWYTVRYARKVGREMKIAAKGGGWL